VGLRRHRRDPGEGGETTSVWPSSSTADGYSSLACELVLAAEDAGISQDALKGQFARTPYAVSFARGSSQFTW
jgi:hypothetical protein